MDHPDLEQAVANLIAGKDAEQSFRLIFTVTLPRVKSFLTAKGLNEEDARDLAQEVLFSVYKGIGQLETGRAFWGWLFTISRNAFANFLEQQNAQKRQHTLAKGPQNQPMHLADTRVDLAEDLLVQERADFLRQALEALPPQMRLCVRIRVLEAASYEEIASRLGLSVNTVKAHLFRARTLLRGQLEPLFREAGR